MGIKQLYNYNLRKLPNEYGDVSVMWWLHWYPNVATIIRNSSTGTRSLVSLQYFVAPMVHYGTNGADTIYSSDTKLAEEQPRDTVVTLRNPWSQQDVLC